MFTSKPKENKDKHFNARVRPSTKNRLKWLSGKTRLSQSEIVERLVEKAKPGDFPFDETDDEEGERDVEQGT